MPDLAFFTRLLDDAPAAERYRLATEQIRHAERFGFDSAWVAQHHFNGDEGGLPSPLVFLAHAASRTSTIQLGTGVITLSLEDPVRVAEDAAVLDALAGGRLQLGFSSGGTPSSFEPFGARFEERHAHFEATFTRLLDALAGQDVGAGNTVYPSAPGLAERIWLATFSTPLAERAGAGGFGLQLSRTQPRPAADPLLPLWDVQHAIIDAYERALPDGVAPRVSIARSVFVADDGAWARELAASRYRASPLARTIVGDDLDRLDDDTLLRRLDVHVGDVETVAASLAEDTSLPRATQLSFQVHSVDPPHDEILRSIELIATEVAPRLGWRPAPTQVESASSASSTR